MREPATFGAHLRSQREQRGISLRSIADSTKVSASYFSGLERGDCSRWPAGIYSRAFVRGYAEVIGLDPDTVASDFFQCYPKLAVPTQLLRTSPSAPAAAAEPAALRPRDELRLVLAEEPSDRVREQAGRLVRVFAVLAAMLLLAAIVGAANGRFWMALGVALITWQIVGAVTRPEPARLEKLAEKVDPSQAPLANAGLAG